MAPGPERTAPDKSRRYSKSERSHEENQERAYIAASRRSDRSLEARMESARRASEIHRRRCGRAFRITEEAVLNEEMYEEEDPDYGQRVSRIYAALANDASFIHQQWLQSQRLRFDQATGRFVVNPFMQNLPSNSPTSPQEPVPFFAYQPGAQPTSTPIRQLGMGNVQEARPEQGASAMNPLNPVTLQNAQFDLSQFQNTEPCQTPQPLSPLSQSSNANPTSQTMFEDNPNPMAAQLNFFTYSTPDFSTFNMGYQYDQMPSMSEFNNQIPNLPSNNLPPTYSTPGFFESDEARAAGGDSFEVSSLDRSSTSDPAELLRQHQATYRKLASPLANVQPPDEHTLQDMQNKMRSSTTTGSDGVSPEVAPPATLKVEDSADLTYEDWLCIPGGSQG